MKEFQWNEEKNELLKTTRGVSFEDAVKTISSGCVIEKTLHPNQIKYPNQKLFIIEIKDYIFLVPFIENSDSFFLKTIIPSRKAKKRYTKVNT